VDFLSHCFAPFIEAFPKKSAGAEVGIDCGRIVALRAQDGPQGPKGLAMGRRRLHPYAIRQPGEERDVKRLALVAPAGALFLAAYALAADPDPALERFREAYISGKGISYVVIETDKGERIYRYGDASREAAKKDTRGFLLFTCRTTRVFVSDSVKDRAALAKAKVVKADEPGFAELDARYLKGCKNPFVKSGIPKDKK
jgi:hypothetical protein